ncbi:hypothetical protein BS78_02G084500 [Paspalum vaginatum]|nr:hypothetical protein BS78_02G084500 [Paspalum vaginatum]
MAALASAVALPARREKNNLVGSWRTRTEAEEHVPPRQFPGPLRSMPPAHLPPPATAAATTSLPCSRPATLVDLGRPKKIGARRGGPCPPTKSSALLILRRLLRRGKKWMGGAGAVAAPQAAAAGSRQPEMQERCPRVRLHRRPRLLVQVHGCEEQQCMVLLRRGWIEVD